jgi:transposase InsO family protein
MIEVMRLIMDDIELQTIEQIEGFLEGNDRVEFKRLAGGGHYRWIEAVLRRFNYPELRRAGKGVIRRYLMKATGYSRAQLCRLINRYDQEGQLEPRRYRRHRFPGKYTREDMELLARTDELHGFLSGPATRKILEREYREFGHEAYRNISRISTAHLYNLRKKISHLGLGKTFTKTKPVVSRIGERAKPDSQGMPGYLRVDTVHQGDFEGIKGLYHINAVDEVTQWEAVVSVQKITESHMQLALREILTGFPFVIRGFHSDNGSEFVNHPVDALLNKLLIRFTKSRPRHSNDNGLVETKNGWVVRKHLGYSHIPQKFAELFNQYYQAFFNPYINFHRPCFFPVTLMDAKGRTRKKYPYEEVMTPYQKLKSLPGADNCLAPGITWQDLDAIANQMSDNEFAERMVKARSDLFDSSSTVLLKIEANFGTFPIFGTTNASVVY